ncbi:site-specific DNA-methyltransferase [Photobacterium damselae subsp. damselae]|uniref:site-specific DNA-methyltransferase n=1 Tax=Photobacterium damselae TaxID=38293 RepID=UPI000D0747EC|nr:site-specific DNA-methyltransferase [Photobacterium damselae]KAB1175027.1 site-specific DNA-methyltransferase [Photobacterium damselae subsp. damselae]PSB90583.1 site-specific DNA-methyltransferase [Photobacterium damselae subsp. damselae]
MSNDQTNVESYEFEPIKGYPMLNWKGKRPFRSTQYFPAQLKEVYGQEDDNGWINKIFWGDNLQVMSHLLKEFRGKVDMIYIDPPFDSKADYKKSIKLRGKNITNDTNSFEEKQYTDIWSNDEFLQFLYERICLMKELLSDTGTICLHCDQHKSHYIKLILDEVFGSDNFINEIVWKRATTVKGNSGQGSRFYAPNIDSIFIYSKSESYIFEQQFTEYSQNYIDSFFKYFEDDGRRYRLISMTAPGDSGKGNPLYEVMGVKRYWRYSESKMNELIKEGLVVQTKPGNVPQKKFYLDEGKGVPVQSLWTDLDGLGAQSNERVGYPTQKPLALLERILLTLTSENSIVFDCFMGSGTTQVAANKLGRRFIGADINLGAIQTTTKRLSNAGAAFEVYNVNNYDVFRNPVEAKELLIEALEIQPLGSNTSYDGEKNGFKVKIMPVNRIATKEDLNDLIQGFPYKQFEERKEANPNQPVEEIMLVCMGHEPGLGAILENESGYKMKVEVVDILRDKSDLTFKYDSEASIEIRDGKLVIEAFYPRNLLQKLSQQKDDVTEWREMVESIMIDWNFDGAVMEPIVIDIPEKDDFVAGEYEIPEGANNIKIKITDLLSESYEEVITHG